MNAVTCRSACLFLILLAFAVLCCGTAWSDWDLGDPYKIHWPQLPDLSVTGMDVNATSPNVLADDFLCTENGPITNIHVWGSWLSDVDDATALFVVSLHADIPASPPQQMFSMPGETLWVRVFGPGEYAMRLYAGAIAEGWMNPPNQYLPPPADTQCFQYNFPVSSQEAFVQTNGTIYWLDVQCLPNLAGALFGWKTTDPQWRWNDDAAWAVGTEPGPFMWTNLVYPTGHPLATETLDLAFVIEGGFEEPPPEPTNAVCPKWIQPPDCDIGLDAASWWMAEGAGLPTIKAADDWLCDGRPVAGVRWWGSYIGWETNSPTPTNPPMGARPVGFRLTWYTDIPASAGSYSRPGVALASNYYPLEYEITNVIPDRGIVVEYPYCVSKLSFISADTYEHEYEYQLLFPRAEYWNEKAGRVYWLSIEAVFASPPAFEWGWKTTPLEWGWNDDATFRFATDPDWNEMLYPPPGWLWLPNHPFEGRSADLAFELLTDVCPSRCTKWAQPPDMVLGQDMQSWHTNGIGILRADDFVSDGRPITDIHWWGSYLGWMSVEPGSEALPIPPPTNANERPLGFKLSWHAHNAADCLPGAQLTNIFVALSNCHEMFYGSVPQPWLGPSMFEHEYQYYVDLLGEGIESPWMESGGVHYWLDIQAVFPPEFDPESGRHRGWGWKITPEEENRECFSVFSTDAGSTWRGDTVGTDGGPLHPRASQNFDLSFELTTADIPAPTNAIPVVFTNMGRWVSASNLYLWSTGHCGCGKQVLQVSSNLLTGEPGWADVWTNPLPRPENLWWSVPASTLKFFRVKQVP